MRSVFFGCLLPPLFPIRLIYGNIINFFATANAYRMKWSSGKSTAPAHAKQDKTPQKKKEVKWAKTDHEFLSRQQLRQYRRMLGDMLIVQGDLTTAQFRNALEKADKEHGEQVGMYLIRNGIITEEQMMRALSHVKHILFIPNAVIRGIVTSSLLNRFDRETLRSRKLLPLSMENGTCILGVCNGTNDADIERFSEENGFPVRRMYVMEDAIDAALAAKPDVTPDHNESMELYNKGALTYEQAVLVCAFAQSQQKEECEVREYMGVAV